MESKTRHSSLTFAFNENSIDADPASGKAPDLKLLLHVKRGTVLNLHELKNTPDWAKPIVTIALKLHTARRDAKK